MTNHAASSADSPPRGLAAIQPERSAVVYLRVSSKRQMDTAADIDPEGNSIATQRQVCQSKVDKMGATIVREFVEPGTSAQTIEKRPVFRQMLAYLAENPTIDYVVIYMRSRAFRNLGDAVITKRRLERMQIKLVSAKEDFGEGIMADAMEAVTDIINEVQVRMSGEDIKVKMRHKAENGGTVGRAKLGYRNIRIDHEGRQVNTIGLDEERAPLIQTAWELYATGSYSIEALYATMADQGLTTRATRRNPAQPVAASQLHRMLSDPYYTGVVVFKGETFPGRHPAIVTQELFDQVQRVLEVRSGRGQRDRVHFHYLKGLLFCERCRQKGRDARLIYIEAKGRTGNIHPYYLCRARQEKLCDLPHLPVAKVEDAVIRFYPNIRLNELFVTETLALIEDTVSDEQRAIRDLHDNFKKQLKALDVKEERLLDLATDGSLPREKIHARLRQVNIDRQRAEAGLRETGEQIKVGAEILATYLRLLQEPAALYEHCPDAQRRQLNDALLERLYIGIDGVGDSWLAEPVAELRDAERAHASHGGEGVGTPQIPYMRRGLGHLTESSRSSETVLLSDRWVGGSSKTVMVGVTGFEPAASSSRTKRATKLRHTPWPAPAPRVVAAARREDSRPASAPPNRPSRGRQPIQEAPVTWTAYDPCRASAERMPPDAQSLRPARSGTSRASARHARDERQQRRLRAAGEAHRGHRGGAEPRGDLQVCRARGRLRRRRRARPRPPP